MQLQEYHSVTITMSYAIDDFNRDAPDIDIVVSSPAGRIICYLDKLAEYHGDSLKIRVNNGAKFHGRTFTNRGKSHVSLDYINSGKLISKWLY